MNLIIVQTSNQKKALKFTGGAQICLNCLENSNKYRMDNIEKNGLILFFNHDYQYVFLRLQSGVNFRLFSGQIKHSKRNFGEQSIKYTYTAGSLQLFMSLNFCDHISLMRYGGIIQKLFHFGAFQEQNELKNDFLMVKIKI